MLKSQFGGFKPTWRVIRRYYLKYPKAFLFSFQFIRLLEIERTPDSPGTLYLCFELSFPAIHCTFLFDSWMPQEMKDELFYSVLDNIPF